MQALIGFIAEVIRRIKKLRIATDAIQTDLDNETDGLGALKDATTSILAHSMIESIQAGSTTIGGSVGENDNNTAINAVDVSKSFIVFNGSYPTGASSDQVDAGTGSCELIGSTSVRCTMYLTDTGSFKVHWTVIELK